MIPVINDIDRLLQAAESRYGEAYARDLQLSASARGFDVALDATVAPSAIVFIATRVGFTGGTVEFSTNNGTLLAVDGDVATLTPAALMGSGCEVVATVTYQGDTHVGRQSVTKLLAFDSSVPPAPTGLAAQGALASINLSWDPTNDTNIGAVEIWRALTNDLSAAAAVGETAGLARTYPDVIGAGGRFYYWIRYISKANVLGPFNAQAGTLGTTGTGAEHLLDLLKDQISESQLLASLRDRINLAVAGSEVAGDVAAALQAETDARIAAIDKEIADRLAALRDEAAAREAYVQNYTYSKVQTDGALAVQAQAIAAAFTSYADEAADEAVAIAAAYVRSYGYSRAAVDAAEAAQTTAITASYRSYADGKKDEALTAAAADVRSYSYSKAGTDGAISSLATTLRAEMASNGGVSEAYVQSYAYSKAQVDSSLAGQSTALTTAYKQYADARKTEAITASAADVRTYAYSKSDTTSAIASSASDLRAEFSNNNGATAAWVQEYAYSKAQTNAAIASQTSTLSSTVGEHTSSIQIQATSIDGLSNQYTVKFDNNGYMAGYGLASTPINGVPTSEFLILANRFAMALPGHVPKYPFVVGTVAGQTVIGFRGDMVLDGSLNVRDVNGKMLLSATGEFGGIVTARNLRVGNPDNILPDPQFKDTAWWSRTEAGVGDWSTASTGWIGGASMYLYPAPYRHSYSAAFQMEPGATYRLSIQTGPSGSFAGRASVFLYIPGLGMHSMGQPNLGSWNRPGDNMEQVHYNGASPKQINTYTSTFTVPAGHPYKYFQIFIATEVTAGWFEFGSVSITRVADGSLVGDGVLSARHIVGDTLDVLAAKLGNVEIGPGGALRQGQTGYDQGIGLFFGAKANGSAALSMATSNGGKLLCDPENGVLKLVNPQIEGQQVAPFTASISGSLYGAVGIGRQGYGSLTVTPGGNFQGPISTRWSVSYETANGTSADVGVSGAVNGSTASFVGSATNERVYVWVSVQIVDAAGRIAQAERFQQVTHGSFSAR